MEVPRGHRVAEPLVRGLVAHHPFAHAALDVGPFGVEDGAGVLHAPELRGGFHVGKFLVRERPHKPLHGLDDLGRVLERHRVGERRVLRVGPDLDGDRVTLADDGAVSADRELPGADDHGVGGDGVGLPPRPFAAAPVLYEYRSAVRDHLPLSRSPYNEHHFGLVIRPVYSREPIPSALRPVVTEVGPASPGSVADNQPIRRHAVVTDRDGLPLTFIISLAATRGLR